MKISKQELNQIIKEEADRFLKIKSLKAEKERIQKELNETYNMEENISEDVDVSVSGDEELSEGWLKDLVADPKKKEEARKAAKMEAEAAIKAGEILKWAGRDTAKAAKVVGQLTDEQASALMSKIEKILDHSEKAHGYNSDFIVTMMPGRDEPTLGALPAGPKTKLGQALAAIGGAAAAAKRMEENVEEYASMEECMEENHLEEGWLKDLVADPKKKEEARKAAKMEAEAAIKAGEIVKWLGRDTAKAKKVIGKLTDEQASALMSKIDKVLDVSEKNHGYNSDFFVAMVPGKDEPTLGALPAGPKTKLGQALAAIGGAAAGAKRMEENVEEYASMEECMEENHLEEGWLKDLVADPKKKEEARKAAKMEAEAAIKAGEIVKWLGRDTAKAKKVIGKLTDEQASALMSKIDKVLDVSEKNHGYNSDFFVAMVPGKDEPTLGALPAGPKTKLGQALAAIGGAAAGAKRMEESEIRRIFREEAEKAEKVKELKEKANQIISEIEKLG